MRIVIRSTVATCLLWASIDPAIAQPPDLIVHHGKIATVDDKFSLVEALAVRGERIVATGRDDDIVKLAGPQTKPVDLQGRTVIPGLCDSHVHASGAALYEYDHAIPEMDTVADVLQYIGVRAAVSKEGEWILVRQVFITRLRDQRYPTRRELDAVAPRNPVMFSTGPDCVCNSRALELSGIDRDFEITDGNAGQIEKDPATGELTGILRNASRFVKSKSNEKSPSLEDRMQRLKQLFADYNSVGLTSIADRSAEWSDFPETADGTRWSVKFAATKNLGEQCLMRRQQDVKQQWFISLNGKRLGELARDENDMTIGLAVPADALQDGDNELVIELPTAGFVACDTHVHTRTHSGHGDATIAERMITLAGEGIELPVATDHNVHRSHICCGCPGCRYRMINFGSR